LLKKNWPLVHDKSKMNDSSPGTTHPLFPRWLSTWRAPLPVAIAVLVATAAALRIWAAQDEFWLDEIWSLVNIARIPHSFADILAFHHDNNHYLITFWMDLVGPLRRDWVLYRVPSLVAGIGTVILALVVTRRWGPCAVLAATLLTGFSFVLLLYSSEARGYSLAGFFALAAFLALERYLATFSPRIAVGFVLAIILGALSHLTFVSFYAGAMAWSGVAMQRGAANWRDVCKRMASLHAMPILFLMALYLIDARAMRIGGGEVSTASDVLRSAAALAVGSVVQWPAMVALSGLFAVTAAIAAIIELRREGSDLWIFFLVTIFVAPVVLLTFLRPPLLYERYFYLQILFFLILMSFLFVRSARSGQAGRAIAIACLALVTAGNLTLDFDLLRVGRGHYLDALRYITKHSPAGDIYLAGDDDFDSQLYLAFYSNSLPTGRNLYFTNYRSQPDDTMQDVQWLMLHSQARPYLPPATIRVGSQNVEFALVRVFPCNRLSGYQFALYQRSRAMAPETTN
jgi:hypothetical protein